MQARDEGGIEGALYGKRMIHTMDQLASEEVLDGKSGGSVIN